MEVIIGKEFLEARKLWIKSVQGRSSWKPNQRSNGFCQVRHGITQLKDTRKIALPENLWLETQNGGLEDNFPFQRSGLQVPNWFSQEFHKETAYINSIRSNTWWHNELGGLLGITAHLLGGAIWGKFRNCINLISYHPRFGKNYPNHSKTLGGKKLPETT